MTDYTMKLEKITPTKAHQILGAQKKNRPLSENRVDAFLAMLDRGEFISEVSVIAFDRHDRLVDGQHRLEMVVRSKKAMTFRVLRGVSEDYQKFIDRPMVRRLSDFLHMEGEEHTMILGATIRHVFSYEKVGYFGGATHAMLLGHPSDFVYLQFLKEHPEIRSSVDWIANIKNHFVGLIPPSVVAASHNIFSRWDQDKATEFWYAVGYGTGMKDDWDPRLMFRNRLLRSVQFPQERMQPKYKTAIGIKAWNAWVTNQKIRRIGWNMGMGESFPEVYLGQKLTPPEVKSQEKGKGKSGRKAPAPHKKKYGGTKQATKKKARKVGVPRHA